MANFQGMILTQRGRNLLAKALSGAQLNFTKVKIGSGRWDNINPEHLTDLVQPRLSLPIQSIEVQGGTAKIRFVLTNHGISEGSFASGGFFASEIGLYANDPQLGEILYAVTYASNPDFIPSPQVTLLEMVVDIYVTVANAQNVTATISDTIVIATKQDIEDLIRKLRNGEILVKGIADASQVPRAHSIPVSDQNGKLHINWLMDEVLTSGYSEYYVGTSPPTSPTEGTLFYNTSNNTLQKFIRGEWVRINWQQLVRATPEWIAGRLRINNSTGRLEISPNGQDWFVCYPLVGASAFRVMTVDNSNFSIIYYMLPGSLAIVRNANHAPFVFVAGNIYSCTASVTSNNDGTLLLWISNIAGTTYYSDLSRLDSQNGGISLQYNGHRIGSFGINQNYRTVFTTFKTINYGNFIEIVGHFKAYHDTYGYLGFSSFGAHSTSGYWLGTFRIDAQGYNLATASAVVVFREA